MTTLEKTKYQIKDLKIPVHIFREKRKNARASIGKEAVIIRLPLGIPEATESKYLQHFKEWLQGQVEKNERLRSRFQYRQLENGMTLTVGSKNYTLHIEETQLNVIRGQVRGNRIDLQLNQAVSRGLEDKNIRHLLSQIVAKDAILDITLKVHTLNARHFNKPIGQIKLKYMHSRWGSCSNSGNINLSTRLLFAPEEVIDYVIIHELAHLVELNHSSQFWKLIEAAVPDYLDKEVWLRENGHLCDFR